MNQGRTSFPIINLAAVLVAISLIAIGTAAAQTSDNSGDATTSVSADTVSTEGTTTETDTSATTPPTEPEDSQTTPSQPAPPFDAAAVTRVHVAGTKYIDYCTDGTAVTPHPGDPAIDSNLNKPDAPTPQCPEGQTWDHTSGMDAYDTT